MKKTMLIFLMLWLGFMWNTSFANKIKVDKDIGSVDHCLSLENDSLLDEKDCLLTIKNKDNINCENNVFVKYYQHHIFFIKKLENQHPYLRKDIFKYHKLFNKWFLELKENKTISKDTINKTNKCLRNLYLKIEQYE